MIHKIRNILFALIFVATSVHAVTIYPVQESWWEKVLRCTWHWSCYQPKLGTAITTINGTDLISNSRSTINTNFSNLNSGKVEVSTTSMGNLTSAPNLTTTGALSSGSLAAGFTAVAVGRGGTGSTTLSANQVLLGNGTTQLNVVNGLGTSGQFLTSQGLALPPQWTTGAIDQTNASNYDFRGQFNTASSTINKLATGTLSATSTVTLSGVPYSFPTTQGVASTTLVNDGSGNLSWRNMGLTELFSKTLQVASSTFGTFDFPAREYLTVVIETSGLASAGSVGITFNRDGGGNYYSKDFLNYTVANQTFAGTSIQLFSQSTTSPVSYIIGVPNLATIHKVFSWSGASSNASAIPMLSTGIATWQNTTAQITQVTISSGVNFNAGTILKVYGSPF